VRSASDSGRFSSSAETSKGQRGKWLERERERERERADAGAAAFACIHEFLSMPIDYHYHGMVWWNFLINTRARR
jgi:hypothetical protein